MNSPIVPRIVGVLVVAAGPPPRESQGNQDLRPVEKDGMERMTTGQEVILTMTSPANLKTMIGLEATRRPSPSLLQHIPLVGKMMVGMPTSTTRLILKAFVKSVPH